MGTSVDRIADGDGLRTVLPSPSQPAEVERLDHRFRSLLSPGEWASLPPAVRRRFSKRLEGGATAVYVGEVAEVSTTRTGRTLARLARVIGGPLPLVWDAPTPSVVSVTEDGAGGGQIWTRLYARRRGFPQMICSAKRFAGPTGLEEHVGGGVGMSLMVGVEDGALVFRSHHYFVSLGGLRARLPAWLEPGRITVAHTELGDGRFAFTLDVVHPVLGRLLRQRAVFREENVQ